MPSPSPSSLVSPQDTRLNRASSQLETLPFAWRTNEELAGIMESEDVGELDDSRPCEGLLQFTIHPRRRSLRNLLRPALHPALPIEKRQHGLRQRGRHERFVMREVGQNCQAVLRHVLPHPAGVFQSAAQ